MNNSVYDEGWDAYFNGLVSSDNPYSYDTIDESKNHMDWDLGWESAANFEYINSYTP